MTTPVPNKMQPTGMAAGTAGGAAVGPQQATAQQPQPNAAGGGYLQGAPGVPGNTNPAQSGWTYGTAPAQGSIQTSVQNNNVNTGYINPANMPVSSVNGGQPYMQRMEDAYYKQAASRLDPRFQQQQSGLENQLANMGLTRGSEAWNREMQNLSFERNDAYGAASNQAILNSGAEAARLQGMDINAGTFANSAAQQNYTNQLTSQQAQNAAMGQEFGQNLQAGQFGNAAQQQSFAQNQANSQIRNDAMSAQGSLANQRYGLDTQRELGTEQNRLQGVNIANQYDLGNRGLDNQRYGIDQTTAASRYGADAGLAGARYGASASMSNSAQQAAVQQRALDQQGQQQAWNQFRQGTMLPYELQNLQMSGMYPTGMPGAPAFPAAGMPQGGNQYQAGLSRNAQNTNMWNAVGSFGGALLNTYGSPNPGAR